MINIAKKPINKQIKCDTFATIQQNNMKTIKIKQFEGII